MATQTYTNNVTLSDAAEFNRFDTVSYAVLSGVAGTNTVTANGPANYTYAATTPPVWFIPAVTNTAATTINITPSGGAALGAKNVFAWGAACSGGELVAGRPCAIIYDGTQFQIINPQPIQVTHTTDITGYGTDPSIDVKITKIGNRVFITVPLITGTSDATTKTFNTAIPAAYRPATEHRAVILSSDNGASNVAGTARFFTNGTVSLYPTTAEGNWTGLGTASVAQFSTNWNV